MPLFIITRVTLNNPRLINLWPSKHNLTNIYNTNTNKNTKKLFTMSRYKKITE